MPQTTSLAQRGAFILGLAFVLVGCSGSGPVGQQAGDSDTGSDEQTRTTTENEGANGAEGNSGSDPVTVRVGGLNVSGDLPLYIARENGYFEERGLDIEFTRTSGDQMIPAITAGQLDIAFVNVVSILSAQSEGFDLSIVAPAQEAGETGPDPAALWVDADSSIESASGLEGEAVAVNGLNNINWLYAREWISENAADSDQVEFREINFPQMPDALLNGQVAAAYGTNPWQGNLVDEGEIRILASPFSDVRPGAPIATYVAQRSYAQENPDVIERFSAALQEAVKFIDENNADARVLWAERDERDPESTADTPLFVFSTTVAKEDLQFTLELMVKHGLIDDASAVAVDDNFVLPIAQDPPSPN